LSRALLSLSDLLSSWAIEDVDKLLKTFICKRDADLQDFFHNNAILYEKRDLSRTFILMEDENVLGYVSLATTVLEVKEDCAISKKLIKKMNLDKGATSAFLIGQLCKAEGIVEGIGKILMELAFVKFSSVRKICGGRVVRVDCKKDLIDYYKKYEFFLISEDPSQKLYRMALLL